MAAPPRFSSIGERVAFYRRQRGWTQQALAMRLNRSHSWVEKIERGARPIDSIRLVMELSQVLGVPPDELLGKPLAPPPAGPQAADPHGDLLELQRVLLHYDSINGPEDLADGAATRPVPELELELGELWRQYLENPLTISAVLWLLPGLIQEARHAVRSASEGAAARRGALAVLAGAYRLAARELRHYGDDSLAWVAAHRAIDTAEQLDDPLQVAAGAKTMQFVLMAQGHLEAAITIADSAGRLVTPGPEAPPAQWCVWGTLQSTAALAAARAQDLAEHDRYARLVTDGVEACGRDLLWESLWFGPANAAVQRVAMLVDLYQPAKALRLAEHLPADPLPQVNRRYYHRVHIARAQFLRRHDDAALRLLVEAERIAPELLRYEAMVHEMVRAMLRRRRTRVPEEVRALAGRLQVTS